MTYILMFVAGAVFWHFSPWLRDKALDLLDRKW